MNELALFAGAGGGLLATKFFNFRTVCAVELDWYCRCLLIQRQNDGLLRPGFPIWDDVCTFDGRAWRGAVYIITGGFPCQPFSTASRGRVVSENLWPEMRRIVDECKPVYVFAENVSKAAIDAAADDCEQMGYKTEAIPLSAKDMGADHVRERYWLLAYADDKSKLRSSINAKVAVSPELCEGFWEAQPSESGMDDGVANRMDRYKAIGNGQVPIVAATALAILAES